MISYIKTNSKVCGRMSADITTTKSTPYIFAKIPNKCFVFVAFFNFQNEENSDNCKNSLDISRHVFIYRIELLIQKQFVVSMYTIFLCIHCGVSLYSSQTSVSYFYTSVIVMRIKFQYVDTKTLHKSRFVSQRINDKSRLYRQATFKN